MKPMSIEFEFRLVGDMASFRNLLETHGITYTLLPKRIHRRFFTRTRRGITHTVHTDEIIERFLIALTPFALDKILKWYNRKRKDTKLSIRYDGNLLDLKRKSKKNLVSLLNLASKKEASYQEKKLLLGVTIQCPVCGYKLGYDAKTYFRAIRVLIPKSLLTCPKCKKESMLIYWKNLTRFPKQPIDRRIRGHK